ncbi:uncharacterized protein LOC62_02G001859 [Vanrija pseudolonga]|uniref:Uncharacterized protein n=1 Tax=Vanrija pseudolonga TaxID=143232 RepID=A0AAF1BG78_9TREE|nr:hypothetical protein LOC62_02G001859 [Vanrija pseudolonga]
MAGEKVTGASCYSFNTTAIKTCCTAASGAFSNQTFAQFNATYTGVVGYLTQNGTVSGAYVGGCNSYSGGAQTLADCLNAAWKDTGVQGRCNFYMSRAERRVSKAAPALRHPPPPPTPNTMVSAGLTSVDCYTSNGFVAMQACCASAMGTYTNVTFAEFNATHPNIVNATAGTNEALSPPLVGGCHSSSAPRPLSDCFDKAKASGIHGVCDYTYKTSRAERGVGAAVWVVFVGLVAGAVLSL